MNMKTSASDKIKSNKNKLKLNNMGKTLLNIGFRKLMQTIKNRAKLREKITH